MKEKDREDLLSLKIALEKASDLRTFPNGREMEMFESVALNQLGKLVEVVVGIIDEIMEGKEPRELVNILREARLKCEDYWNKRDFDR